MQLFHTCSSAPPQPAQTGCCSRCSALAPARQQSPFEPTSLCFKNIQSQEDQRFFFVECKQLLKGIVYPLAVKSTQLLDLAQQKQHLTFWSSQVQFPPFVGTLIIFL